MPYLFAHLNEGIGAERFETYSALAEWKLHGV